MRATFAPIPSEVQRPRWSVMIPAYNCAHFLKVTLESVLSQDLGPELMQIEVIDDASADDAAGVVAEIGKGRVGFFRQPVNQGHVRNFATCIERARGEIVHLLHGDDFVLPGFYGALGRAFDQDAEVGAAFCRWKIVDEEGRTTTVAEPEEPTAGRLQDSLARLASEQRIVTPSIAVRRSAYERLGGFDPRPRRAEDWEMWVRIAANYPIWYEPQLLAAYRNVFHSNSGRDLDGAEWLRDSWTAIRLFRPLLPPARRAGIVRAASRAYARSAICQARRHASNGAHRAVWNHARMALWLDPRPTTLREILAVLLRKTRA